MPIEIHSCDGNIGSSIECRGVLTDDDLIGTLKGYLTQDREQFKTSRYILFDYTALTKVTISDDTVETAARMYADISKANPDTVVAIVTNLTFGANIDRINLVSKMNDVFIHRSSWEPMIFRTRPEAVRWIRAKVRDRFGIDELNMA